MAAPLRLFYKRPAKSWTEALPLGNGRIGAMVYGGVAEETIPLNDDTFYGGEPVPYGNGPNMRRDEDEVRRLLDLGDYAAAEAIIASRWLDHGRPAGERPFESYQPIGALLLSFSHGTDGIVDYERELEIRNAMAGVSYQAGGLTYRREAFVSYPDNIFVYRLQSGQPGKLSFRARLVSPHPSSVLTKADGMMLRGQAPSASGHGGIRFAVRLTVCECDGEISWDGSHLKVANASTATVLLAIATNFEAYDRPPGASGADEAGIARQHLHAAAALGFKNLQERHQLDFGRLFDRVDLELRNGASDPSSIPTDERLEAVSTGAVEDPGLAALYFQFGRYLLISASRPGTQAMNLQGIWSRELQPPWNGAYTLNINLPMNYWLAETGNLSECHEPLFALIRDLAARGKAIARGMYGRLGWVCHHSTSLWRHGEPVNGAPAWAFWPMAGGWLCQHLWAHWEFTGDLPFLREAYPVLKGASEFFLSWLVEDREGFLVSFAGTSPENLFRYRDRDGVERTASISAGPTMDMAIIRECFSQTAAAAALLGIDADFAGNLEKSLPRLLPHRVGRRGQLQEWSRDFDEADVHHRHISHLYGLHPGNQIALAENPELCAAARRALDLRGDASTGWSTAWKINLWARLGEGNRALELIHRLLSLTQATEIYGAGGVYPNLFCAHPPFQIDGNLGGAAGIAEMLLQSHNGSIELLPALPDAWPEGRVRGLRARGGFELNLTWQSGHLTKVEVLSLTGGVCRIRSQSREISFPAEKGRKYAFNGWLRSFSTVLCFGDSITEGNTLPAEEKGQAWVHVVERASEGRFRLINEGKGGRPTGSLDEFQSALDRHANESITALLIALGTNDSRDISNECVPKAVENISKMIATARRLHPDWHILLAGPPNLRKDTLGPTKIIADQREQNLIELNRAYKQLADSTGSAFIGLFGVVSPSSLATDGIHPDAEGHQAIAGKILDALVSHPLISQAAPGQ